VRRPSKQARPVRSVVWDRPIESAKLLTELERRLVDQRFSNWNRIELLLRHIRTLETLVQGSN
jgi:hypothetical protein